MNEQMPPFSRLAGEQMSKVLAEFQFPNLNIQSLIENQQRNMEAMAQATRIATEGANAMYRRQIELVQLAAEQLAAMLRELRVPLPDQAELARRIFDVALANAREMAELAARANTEAFEVIQRRMIESFAEIRASLPAVPVKS